MIIIINYKKFLELFISGSSCQNCRELFISERSFLNTEDNILKWKIAVELSKSLSDLKTVTYNGRKYNCMDENFKKWVHSFEEIVI